MALPQEIIRDVFNQLDLDRDSKVDIAELITNPLLPLIMKETQTPPDVLLAKHDSDQDGKLTLEEFQKAFTIVGN